METLWTDAVCSLGGNRQVAAEAAADLAARTNIARELGSLTAAGP